MASINFDLRFRGFSYSTFCVLNVTSPFHVKIIVLGLRREDRNNQNSLLLFEPLGNFILPAAFNYLSVFSYFRKE